MISVEAELADLKARVEQLESRFDLPSHVKSKSNGPHKPIDQMTRDELRAWMLAEGLIINPPAGVHVYAQRWRSLSEQEREAVRRELDHLPPGPMVSDIVIDNRR